MIKGDASQGAKPIAVLSRYSALVKEVSGDNYMKSVSARIRTGLSESFGLYVDAKARSRPLSLHHVYEWGQIGNPGARLFKLTGKNHGGANFSLGYSLLPSTAPVPGGNDVFTLKAQIMEDSVTVIVKPKGRVLVFDTPVGEVFTTKPVVIKTPGGRAVAGSMASVFSTYFNPNSINANPVYNTVLNQASKEIERRAQAAGRG